MKSKVKVFVAALAALSFVAAGCSSSKSASSTSTSAPANTTATSDSTATSDTSSSGSSTTAPSQRNVFKAISGVPGVSDKEIAFTAIGTKSNNPLGTCILDCYADGIKAYFAYQNAAGGIYGRQLVLSDAVDDELGNDQVRSLDVISNKKAFAVFSANLLSSGWGDLDKAGIPNFVWGIQPKDANGRTTVFGSAVSPTSLCDLCTMHQVAYAVKTVGAKHVAALGISATENSKNCATADKSSIERYSSDIGADFVYLNNNIAFGIPNGIGPEVTAMKDAGVDFIASCMDSNSDKTLAQELHRQGMDNVTVYHPQMYNQDFVANAGGLFDGDVVQVAFTPFEADKTGTTLGEFVDWMGKAGKSPNEMAMTGWINASQAFEGLLGAGPEFDRAKVIAAMNAMTADTAGGLISPVNWTTMHTPYTETTRPAGEQDCMALVKIENGKFVTVAPAKTPWTCWTGTDWKDPEFKSFS